MTGHTTLRPIAGAPPGAPNAEFPTEQRAPEPWSAGEAPIAVEGEAPASPDPLVLPNCHIIYTPKGQAWEYARLATSPYLGCGHRCPYCFVPRIRHVTREEFDAGAVPREDYLKRLRRDAEKYLGAGITEQVLISFMTDPYHPGDTSLTRATLEVLTEYGMAFVPLTKGGTRALRDLDLFRPNCDAFFTTLTSLDDSFSLKWERNAPLPDDRILAIRRFHDAGIFTIVSIEPTLNIEHSLAVIRATHSFVDLFKVGRANNLGALTKTTNWREYTHRVIDLFGQLGNKHYIKRDLQAHLPSGYRNPLRIQQHH